MGKIRPDKGSAPASGKMPPPASDAQPPASGTTANGRTVSRHTADGTQLKQTSDAAPRERPSLVKRISQSLLSHIRSEPQSGSDSDDSASASSISESPSSSSLSSQDSQSSSELAPRQQKRDLSPSIRCTPLNNATDCLAIAINTVSGDVSYQRVHDFLNRTEYQASLRAFLINLDNLDSQHNLLDEDTEIAVTEFLRADTSVPSTQLEIVEDALQKHGITLQLLSNNTSDSRDYEHTLVHDNEQMVETRKRIYFNAYRLMLALEMLKSDLTMKSAALEPNNRAAAKELTSIVDNDLRSLTTDTQGLCHAALKVELPEYFSDTVFTPIKIQGPDGQFWFHSDGVQARGGWMDR